MWRTGLCAAALLWAAASPAQTATAEALRAAAGQAPALAFPAEPSSLSFFSSPQMALYKPEGAGPFPALVLLHQCGGLGSAGRWQNLAMLDWARKAVARGYVALLVDALGPRGVDSVCFGPKNGVNFATGLRDALQAARHLRGFDFVDGARVALAGYSWGAMVGVLASGRTWAEALGPGQRFAAAVSFYPGCFTVRPPGRTPYEIVQPDIDRPLLVLLGGRDTETPADECLSRLGPLRERGAPLEWQVYPEATHCWDCRNLHGYSKTDVRGNHVTYSYDSSITDDSERRMFEFLDRTMGAAPR